MNVLFGTRVARSLLQGSTARRAFGATLLAGTALALVAPATAAAQTAPAGYELQEVVVTAQKRAERLEDVPATIIAVTGEQLAERGVTNMQDLVRTVPGIRIDSFGSFGIPAIRGIAGAQSGVGSEVSTAIFLDGAYMAARTALMFNLPDVQQIEVLKGPQSTLSGRSALGGAILITTLEPTSTFSGLLRAEAGGYDGGGGSGTVRGFVAGPLSTNLAGSVSFGYDRNWGFIRNVAKHNELTAGGFTQFVRGKLKYAPTDNFKVVASAWYTKDNNPAQVQFAPFACNLTPAFGACIVPGDWHVNVDFTGYSRTRQYGATLRADWDLGEGTLSSISSYVNNRYGSLYEFDGTALLTALAYQVIPTKTWSQEFTLASQQHEKFSYILGASVLRVDDELAPFSVFSATGATILQTYSLFRATSYAAYGELTYNLTDRLVLTAGVRYIRENKKQIVGAVNPPFTVPGRVRTVGDRTWDYWAPRVSVRYKLDEHSNLYATYSTGFKTAAFNSNAFTGDIINPETLKAYEIGYKTATARYSVNLSAYMYRFKDFQTSVSVQNLVTGIFSSVLRNAANAKATGVDAEGSFYLTPDLLVSGGFAWQPTAKYGPFANAVVALPNVGRPGVNGSAVTDLTGKRLLKAPRFTFNGRVAYTTHLDAGDLIAGSSIYRTSRFIYDLPGVNFQKPYTTVDVDLAFKPAGTKLKATVWVRNLTNEAYFRGYFVGTFMANTWAPPRQYGVTLEQRF